MVWRKFHAKQKNRIEIYRYTQTFSLEELDPNNSADVRKAHKLGVQLAHKIMGRTHHLCIVATQKDGDGGNLHNHIFICSQDYLSGKAIRGKQKNVADLQRWNDEVLHENQMFQPESIRKEFDSVRAGEKHTIAEIKMRKRQIYVWKDDLRGRIDKVQQKSLSWTDYLSRLADQGVECRAFRKKAFNSRGELINENLKLKYISYTFTDKRGKVHKIRDKSLGTDYGSKNVEQWFQNNRKGVILNETSKQFKQQAEQSVKRSFGKLTVGSITAEPQCSEEYEPVGGTVTKRRAVRKGYCTAKSEPEQDEVIF